MRFRRKRPTPPTPDRFHPAPHARQIVGNLMVLADGMILAGYRVGEARWDFLPDEEKLATLEGSAQVWANLAREGGRTVIERTTTRPFPVQAWARALDRRTPHPLPDVHTCSPEQYTTATRLSGACGCRTWNAYLAMQQHRIAQAGLDAKMVYRYIEVGQARPGADVRSLILSTRDAGLLPAQVPSTALRDALREEQRVANIVGPWRAKRMTERDQVWLRTRALAPTAMPSRTAADPFEAGLDEADLDSIAANASWSEDPHHGRHVEVTSFVRGKPVGGAVRVLTMSRMPDLNYPAAGYEPWQTFAERAVDAEGMPFTVEWSMTGKMHTGADVLAQAESELRLAMNLERDYAVQEEPAPAQIEEGIMAAKRIRDEISTGKDVDAARFIGSIHAIVTGHDVLDEQGRVVRSAAEVVEERADALARLYAGPPLRMSLVAERLHPHVTLTATIPGEKAEGIAHQRRIKPIMLAAALPEASSQVGDGVGDYLAYTRGAARRPCLHDSHFATEGRGSLGRGNNMWVLGSALGGGKSIINGRIAYSNVRRGIRTIIEDPSGPLLKLCDLPELAPFSQPVDLTQGEPGILNPCSLIREPRREEFDNDKKFEAAVKAASAERASLLTDFVRRIVDPDLYEHHGLFGTLSSAMRLTSHWTTKHSPWTLIANLRALRNEFADQVAESILRVAPMPLFNLAFPPQDSTEDSGLRFDAMLTVISSPGVKRAPEARERKDWSDTERGADMVLTLSGFVTDKFAYGKPMAERAVLIFDEAENLTDSASGRGYLSRLGRDHSKWNIAVYLSVKSVGAHMFSGELKNFVAGAFVGKMASEEAAEPFLSILTVEDRRYAKMLTRQSRSVPGEFVHLDARGQVGAVRVDVEHMPFLKDALFTDPVDESIDSADWSGDFDEAVA